MTTSLLRGIVTSRFLRLWTLAPSTTNLAFSFFTTTLFNGPTISNMNVKSVTFLVFKNLKLYFEIFYCTFDNDAAIVYRESKNFNIRITNIKYIKCQCNNKN
jgi:hypothetical protein